MKITTSVFSQSASKIEQCPKSDLKEFAFIGRSNVGKSSLINMLCNNSKLAKTSSTPGKTQLINHFKINNSFYFVDLPGYGYAKANKSARDKFEKIIHDYCINRKNLKCLFVLVDSRLPLQKIDLEFMQWCTEYAVPITILYTKADKNSKRELTNNLKKIESELLNYWDEMPNTFISSSTKISGKQEILNFIDTLKKE